MTPLEIAINQRNNSLAAAANAEMRQQLAAQAAEAAFIALNECILSGQIPEGSVPSLISSVPGFAEWRAATIPKD